MAPIAFSMFLDQLCVSMETASARIASPDTVELAALERGAAPGRGLSRTNAEVLGAVLRRSFGRAAVAGEEPA